jgi:hypothetical protein
MGFAMNCRHGRLMAPAFKVLLGSRGFFVRLGPWESHVPEGLLIVEPKAAEETAEMVEKRPIDRRT